MLYTHSKFYHPIFTFITSLNLYLLYSYIFKNKKIGTQNPSLKNLLLFKNNILNVKGIIYSVTLLIERNSGASCTD